jgi:hypothetical protein
MSITPSSPQTITPHATLDEAAGTYVDFTIDRPAFGSPTLRVTFTATAANRTSDSDAIDVPSQERDTVGLSCRILRVSETATQIVVNLEVISPNAGATVTVAYDNGGLTVTPASGGTLTSTTTFGTTAHIQYTITKPAFGAGGRRVTFTASATGFVDTTDAVDVSEQSTDFTIPTLNLSPTISDTQYSIAFASTGTVQYKIDAGSFGSATSPQVISRTTAAQAVTFSAVLNGQTVYVSITVSALGPGTFSSCTNVLYSAATDQVDFTWTWSGPSATFNVWVNDYARGFVQVTSGISASTYRYTAQENLLSSGAPTGSIGFYVQGIVGSTVNATSSTFFTPYIT